MYVYVCLFVCLFRLWDLRAGGCGLCACLLSASKADVNSISFSALNQNLLLSGDEEGLIRVYDLRYTEMPLAEMNWHSQPITVQTLNPKP